MIEQLHFEQVKAYTGYSGQCYLSTNATEFCKHIYAIIIKADIFNFEARYCIFGFFS